MELTVKKRIYIALLYGLIVAFSNFIGVMLPIPPSLKSLSMQEYLRLLETYQEYIPLIMITTYTIPTVLCFSYIHNTSGDKFYSRFINMPAAFSFLGVSGWVFFFILEAVILFIVKYNNGISIAPILLTSGLSTMLIGLLSFTISYFSLETLHRKLFLPMFFPEGHLTRYKNFANPSVRFLFFVFYISAGILPMFYIFSAFYAEKLGNGTKPDTTTLVAQIVLIVFGIILCVVFLDYFNAPLKKLYNGTEKIKNGDYSTRVKIVSTDSFGKLADSFNEMAVALDAKTRKILSIQNSIVTGMAVMVESRDNSTGGHIMRTSDCVKIFMQELKRSPEFSFLTESFCDSVIKAAPMHDLGKIAVDDAILRKPGKFTDEEYEKMKKHSEEGARIVENVLKEVEDIEFKSIAVNIAHYHHEKFDGQGYPEKLSGDAIPIEARIMALADVFDALVSRRCYKDSFSYDKAFSIIEDSLGTHFDPALGTVFIQCRAKLEALYNSYSA